MVEGGDAARGAASWPTRSRRSRGSVYTSRPRRGRGREPKETPQSACAESSATPVPARRAPSSSRASAASSTAATTPPGSRSWTRQGDLFVEKKAGKLANLQTAIADRTPHAAIGLAHTRWATHGRPNDLNAHPHQDCTGEITVIHNGIIENFRELRDGLEARGHTLTSETDTEAIAHLVEEAYDGRPRRRRPRVAAPGRGRLRARR